MTQPWHYKEFYSSLGELQRKGGKHGRVANKVLRILSTLNVGCEELKDLPVTNHGENRIKHCRKYMLDDSFRLVTIHSSHMVVFCFVGAHKDVDKWIDNNRGLEFGKTAQGGTLQPMVRSPSDEFRIKPTAEGNRGNLIDRLGKDRQNELFESVSERNVIGEIYRLGELVNAPDIEELCRSIADKKQQSFVYDVLCFLSANQVQQAENRIDMHYGVIKTQEALSPEDLLEIPDGDEVRRIEIGTPEHEKWLNQFAESNDYWDWLLFLHPEQRKVVKSDFTGPATLAGVSGSGKTCVAIHRAIRLAEETPTEKVLVVTLNSSLAGLIQSLVERAPLADASVRKRITIRSFFHLCQEFLRRFEPENRRLYLDVSYKLEEHVDEVFREYYRCWLNNDSAKVLQPIHNSLIAQKIDAETYIREEFDWIRSGIVETDRPAYGGVTRQGRRVALREELRNKILTGLSAWEEKMKEIGVIDYLGLTTALSKHLSKLKPEYDHVIVDEAQDFGTTELKVLRKLCKSGPNDLFLCSDIAQHVLPRMRSLTEAGIIAKGRQNRIVRNYRNTKEILKAAYEVLTNNLDETTLDDAEFEILDPDYSSRSSNLPLALKADSLEDEIAYSRKTIDEHLDGHTGDKCCIAFAGFTNRDIQAYGKAYGVQVLSGDREPLSAGLVFSDLEQTKGYEFDVVIILNCNRRNLPPIGTPKEEAFRHGCRLYVAMTRAKNELYLSYSGEPSEWLAKTSDSLTFMNWNQIMDLEPSLRTALPERLHQSESGPKGRSVQELLLTGDEFLYTPEARGLSLEAIQKLSELVDGKGAFKNKHRVKWGTVNALLRDLQSHAPRVVSLFGPKVSKELEGHLARAYEHVRRK